MWFSYDHEDGVSFHDTPEQAKAAAERAFGFDQDEAPDGWHEEVATICWGEVRGRVAETSRRPTTPEDGIDCAEFVEYSLVDVKGGA